MASVTVTLAGACASGGHLTFAVTGDITATLRAHADDLLGAISDEDRTAFLKVLLRLVKQGRTMAQAKAALEAGVTVSV